MIYKRFYVNIFIRIILILINCLLFSFVFTREGLIYTKLFLGLTILFQTGFLISYINKINQQLARFFNALKDDSAFYKVTNAFENKSNAALSKILNQTSLLLKEARVESEKQYRFMKFIFDASPGGMIIYNENEEIVHANKWFKREFGLNTLSSLSQLDSIHGGFRKRIRSIKPGNHEIVKFPVKNELMIYRIGISRFVMDYETYFLALVQDFKYEIETNEIESWQKLIRVINHEIMNSLTPIINLTEAIQIGAKNYKRSLNDENSLAETINDVVINAQLIEDRSQGLKDFINNYRVISNIQKIDIREIVLHELILNSTSLFAGDIKKRGIVTEVSVKPEDLVVNGDRYLLEQVFVNLIKNAIEALEKTTKPQISISASLNKDDAVEIIFKDNGCGIKPEHIHEVFVPFFTTKDHGAGIGLSLSRHILRLHKGSISVSSEPGKQTTIVLKL